MTKFEHFKENLTVETLAKLTVRLVVVDNSETYYLTSSGQLYPMTSQGLTAAIKHELSFWNEEIKEEKKEDEKLKEEDMYY